MSEDQEDRVGIFPNWGWVYRTVVIYGVLMIGVLILLSRILGFGAGP